MLGVAEDCPITSESSSLTVPSHVASSFFGQMVENEGLFLSQSVDTGVGGEEEIQYPFLELRTPESPALGLRGTVSLWVPQGWKSRSFFSHL